MHRALGLASILLSATALVLLTAAIGVLLSEFFTSSRPDAAVTQPGYPAPWSKRTCFPPGFTGLKLSIFLTILPNRQTAKPPNRQINHTFILCGMLIACE